METVSISHSFKKLDSEEEKKRGGGRPYDIRGMIRLKYRMRLRRTRQ